MVVERVEKYLIRFFGWLDLMDLGFFGVIYNIIYVFMVIK